MLEDMIIIGIVMALVELAKHLLRRVLDGDIVTQLLPLIVLLLAGGLNVANALVFDSEISVKVALAQGLTLGATAGGIYSLGKAALGKS